MNLNDDDMVSVALREHMAQSITRQLGALLNEIADMTDELGRVNMDDMLKLNPPVDLLRELYDTLQSAQATMGTARVAFGAIVILSEAGRTCGDDE